MTGDPTVVCRWPVSPKSKSGRSVARYSANVASAIRTAGRIARRRVWPPGSAAGTLAGDDGTNLRQRPRVDHVPRLDPAAARRGDAELHLPFEQFRAMAVAVDDQIGAGGDGAA